jgi:hypothetical protein
MKNNRWRQTTIHIFKWVILCCGGEPWGHHVTLKLQEMHGNTQQLSGNPLLINGLVVNP